MIERYWGEERVYHHTAPISMNYALLEALRLVAEEGLEARWRAPRAEPPRARRRGWRRWGSSWRRRRATSSGR